MSADSKKRCADLINEAGLVRLLVTNLRSMIEQSRDVLNGRDCDAEVAALISAEMIMTGICRSQMIESNGNCVLKDTPNPVRVYPAYPNPRPTPDHIEKLLLGADE